MDTNKIILITGTRKGIGRYLSEYYLERGFLVIGCSRGESDLNHPRYDHFCVDVADERAVIEMIASARNRHGRIDYLVSSRVNIFIAPLQM